MFRPFARRIWSGTRTFRIGTWTFRLGAWRFRLFLPAHWVKVCELRVGVLVAEVLHRDRLDADGLEGLGDRKRWAHRAEGREVATRQAIHGRALGLVPRDDRDPAGADAVDLRLTGVGGDQVQVDLAVPVLVASVPVRLTATLDAVDGAVAVRADGLSVAGLDSSLLPPALQQQVQIGRAHV